MAPAPKEQWHQCQHSNGATAMAPVPKNNCSHANNNGTTAKRAAASATISTTTTATTAQTTKTTIKIPTTMTMAQTSTTTKNKNKTITPTKSTTKTVQQRWGGTRYVAYHTRQAAFCHAKLLERLGPVLVLPGRAYVSSGMVAMFPGTGTWYLVPGNVAWGKEAKRHKSTCWLCIPLVLVPCMAGILLRVVCVKKA